MNSISEIKLRGRAVSRGTALGTVTCLYGRRRQFFRRTIGREETQNEIERVNSSIRDATSRLENEIDCPTPRQAVTEILETHLAIIRDPTLQNRFTTKIETDRVNAEWAVHSVCNQVASTFAESGDEQLKEKRLDIDDVCELLLTGLGLAESEITLSKNAIIVAKEVSPAMLIRLADAGLIGMVSESGGWTSHTSILARELGIPAVTGVSAIFDRLSNGMNVLVDGYSGNVVVDPSETTASNAQFKSEPGPPKQNLIITDRNFTTVDGRAIVVRTNVTTVDGYYAARDLGAQGIGLFRSESMIDSNGTIPSEDQQTAMYMKIATAAGEAGVRIRTFDIEASQFPLTSSIRQKNPALGLRAIRLGLENIELLVVQVRAMLRAAANNSIGLVVPMVSGVSDVDSVRHVVAEQTSYLEAKGEAIGKLSIGAMIEVPSSIMIIDQLMPVCDFLCLGTNDLAQYLLAADRDNEAVSKWFRTLHPAILRAVKLVIDESVRANIPLVVCGEMAGSPFYAPVLIGLGATELSMNPSSIQAVAQVISGIRYGDAVDLVQRMEDLTDPEEMEKLVFDVAKEKWPDLFTPGFLDQHLS